MRNEVEIYPARRCLSNGEPFTPPHPELGEEPVPEPIREREEQNPFAQWIADGMRFRGDRPSAAVSVNRTMVIVSELEPNLVGVLKGVRTNGHTLWKSYNRIALTFRDACEQLNEWSAKNRKLPFPEEDAA